ncbi:STAS domain-containing protein [Roseomonas eburnea]|uniref:Anti-sigma factor antagonist n=1 Tax=Neoroseomonas eburnea TaxID=1346889 RepID=A0A9X9XID3_9PROT|nr:STAS domain-containing protein [Neoroseomonas eburnea]MBR0683469.1 STAS domain-containing protein [Neoroseomonas eburnea]
MDMVVDTGGASLRVMLAGRLDAAGAEKLETAFTTAVGVAARDVVVDLSGVTFVGSLGIRLLTVAARQVARAKRRFVICGAQPAVSEVFTTVALDELIPIVADEAAARAHLGA